MGHVPYAHIRAYTCIYGPHSAIYLRKRCETHIRCPSLSNKKPVNKRLRCQIKWVRLSHRTEQRAKATVLWSHIAHAHSEWPHDPSLWATDDVNPCYRYAFVGSLNTSTMPAWSDHHTSRSRSPPRSRLSSNHHSRRAHGSLHRRSAYDSNESVELRENPMDITKNTLVPSYSETSLLTVRDNMADRMSAI